MTKKRIKTEGPEWAALEAALFEWRNDADGTEKGMDAAILALSDAIDAATYIPEIPFHEALQEELGEEEWEINPSKIEDEVLVFCKNRPEWPHPWLRLSAQDDPKKVADALRVLAGEDEG